MTTMAIAVWLAGVLLDTAGRIAFKSAALTGASGGQIERWGRMLRAPALWCGIACFGLEFVVWLALLSLIPLSQAILIGTVNIVAVALAGRIFFHERIDASRAAGVALIAIGVALAGGLA